MPGVVTVAYFGEKWDAPHLDEEPDKVVVQIPTPVGEICPLCEEPVNDGDRGLMMPFVTTVDGDWVGKPRPVHAECNLRQVLGSPAHLMGTCRCSGHNEPPFAGTRREEAQVVVRIVNRRRQRNHQGPIW